jgi:hypothetical protein
MGCTGTNGCDRGCGEDLSEHSRRAEPADPTYRPGVLRRHPGDPGGDGRN